MAGSFGCPSESGEYAAIVSWLMPRRASRSRTVFFINFWPHFVRSQSTQAMISGDQQFLEL